MPWMTVPIALAIGSTALTVGSKIAGGIADRRAAQYQAGIADRNAALAEWNARRSLQRGDVEAQEADFENVALIGTQRAGRGASGVTVNSRSQVATEAATKVLADLDRRRIREGARLEAANFRTTGEGLTAEAAALRRSGRGALLRGFLEGGASLITGAARVGAVRNAPSRSDAYRTLFA